MPSDELNPKTLLVDFPMDAYELVRDYIGTNLEWDSDSAEKQEVIDALRKIEDAMRAASSSLNMGQSNTS